MGFFSITWSSCVRLVEGTEMLIERVCDDIGDQAQQPNP